MAGAVLYRQTLSLPQGLELDAVAWYRACVLPLQSGSDLPQANMERFSNLGAGNASPSDSPPWLRPPSIAQHIRTHLDPVTGRLSPEGVVLPDEAAVAGVGDLRWAPGAKDGAFGHHFGGTNSDQAQVIIDHLLIIAEHDSSQAKVTLYELLRDNFVLSVIDPVLETLITRQLNLSPYLHRFARLLASEAPDRGPVKLAIGLLGVVGDPDDVELVVLLGRHDEFTLYSAVALNTMLSEPEQELWRLAQLVHGWGRIQLVERLAGTSNPDIKAWMLREGFRNGVMYEYLAYICATTGELSTVLAVGPMDDELLDSVGEIIEALLSGGPAKDINDYVDAAFSLQHYLARLATAPRSLGRLTIVASIVHYLEDEDWHDSERGRNGWTPHLREQVRDDARQYLAEPGWRELVAVELESEDEMRLRIAARAARAIGVDLWPMYWARLQANPQDVNCWLLMMSWVTDATIKQVVELAVQELPLQTLGSGPSEARGVGKGSNAYRLFDTIVPRLAKHPGLGWPIIASALRSPVIRHRNQALRTLATWKQENWLPTVRVALEAALIEEPTDKVRVRIERVLRGELPDPERPNRR
jgi:hypothetical protein